MSRQFLIATAPPKVTVVGSTMPVIDGFDDALAYRDITWNTEPIEGDPLSILEGAGRVCYDSFHNPANKTREEYLRTSIIEHAHESVLEHVVINFMVQSLPRSTQLELMRHRVGVANSWRSTRFTDNWLEFVVPPVMRDGGVLEKNFVQSSKNVFNEYNTLLEELEKTVVFPEDYPKTLRRKRIKEAARSILPNSLGSDGMFSANIRTIRHIVLLRTDEHADESIREFSHELFITANEYLGDALFDDFSTREIDFGVPETTKL